MIFIMLTICEKAAREIGPFWYLIKNIRMQKLKNTLLRWKIGARFLFDFDLRCITSLQLFIVFEIEINSIFLYSNKLTHNTERKSWYTHKAYELYLN